MVRTNKISLFIIGKQDCIPVGCILSACWPYLPACTARVGDCSQEGCLLPGRWVSQHALRQTPPAPREQNDRQVQKYYLASNFVGGNKLKIFVMFQHPSKTSRPLVDFNSRRWSLIRICAPSSWRPSHRCPSWSSITERRSRKFGQNLKQEFPGK